jgi:hypothetical protein
VALFYFFGSLLGTLFSPSFTQTPYLFHQSRTMIARHQFLVPEELAHPSRAPRLEISGQGPSVLSRMEFSILNFNEGVKFMEKPIKMSKEEKHKRKLDKWLSTLTVDSEFFGLLGLSHTDSFYKIYVRQNRSSKKWWIFETDSSISHTDPIKYQTKLSKENNKDQVFGKLMNLLKYKIHPGKKGLEMIFSRAKQLSPV